MKSILGTLLRLLFPISYLNTEKKYSKDDLRHATSLHNDLYSDNVHSIVSVYLAVLS